MHYHFYEIRKSSSFLFSEHIFNPWSTFFLLNAICLTAYKIESFAIGIPKQINTNIELCSGKIWLMRMILCSFQELFHLCSDTVNEQLFPYRQWSLSLLIKTKTCQIRDILPCWPKQSTEIFTVQIYIILLEKKKKKKGVHLLRHCLQEYLSVYISLYQWGRRGLALISMLVNVSNSSLSQNAPGLKIQQLWQPASLVLQEEEEIRRGQRKPPSHNTLTWKNLGLLLVISVRSKLISSATVICN